MKLKRLICKIFGHKYEVGLYKRKDYRTIYGSLPCGGRSKTTRKRKKVVVKHFRKCKRCGAYIMVKY